MPATPRDGATGKRRSELLRQRLVFLLLAIVPLVILALALVGLFARRMNDQAESWAREHATGLSRALGRAVLPGLDFNDDAFVKRFLGRVTTARQFVYITVRRADGSLLAGSGATAAADEAPAAGGRAHGVTVVRRGDVLHVRTPLKAQGGAHGTLQLGLSMATLTRQQRQNQLVAGAAAATMLLFGLVFALLGNSFITRRYRAEQALRRSEARFRALIECLPDAIWLLRDGQVTYASPPAALYLGAAGTATDDTGEEGSDPGVTWPWAELVHPDDRELLRRQLARLGHAGDAVRVGELRLGRDPGEWIPAEVTAMALALQRGPTTVVVARDMTEYKRMQATVMLSDRMASMGTLAAGVAHEINNPMTYIAGNLEFATQMLPQVQVADLESREIVAEVRKALEESQEGAIRVRDIVSDLNTFSRTDTTEAEPVDLVRVIESSVNITWNQIRHRARLVRRLETTPPVKGNTSRLGQVFTNLLVNAAQALPAGQAGRNTITVATRITEEGLVAAEVRDTGPGIPPEAHKQLFDAFFTTKPVGEGTGLGLFICHNIVRDMGGSIQVESEPGQGACFRVLLRPASGDEQRPEAVAPPGPPALPSCRVLVVDDEPDVGHAVQRILAEHDVTLAHSGETALELLQADQAFDVILCDLMMPEMSGMQLVQTLQQQMPRLARRLVLMSGGGFSQEARDFFETTELPRLEKPFDHDQLLQQMRRALERG